MPKRKKKSYEKKALEERYIEETPFICNICGNKSKMRNICDSCYGKKRRQDIKEGKKTPVIVKCKYCGKVKEHHAHGSCRSCYTLAYSNLVPYKVWARGSIANHKRKGYFIKIKLEVLSEKASKTRECAYCGRPLKWEYGKGRPESRPTVDRIDNSNVLREDNINIVCCSCNTSKGSRTLEEWKDYMKNVLFRLER